MPHQLRESKWIYNTAATSGLGMEMLAASGGTIVLTDPSNEDQSFSYAGFGIGFISVPIPKIKLPPLPLLNRDIGATGAAKSFFGDGVIYMTASFQGRELAKSDMQGGSVYLDGSSGLLAGYGGSVMLLGINTAFLAPWLLSPGIGANLAANAMQQAPAILVMHGQTEGLIASVAGVSAMIGYLH
jgi:hypothetical protein